MGLAWLRPVIAICAGVAATLVWALGTPIFAEPDEQAHLDYVLAIAHHGLDARSQTGRFRTDGDPLLRSLETALHYRELRFDSTYRAPAQTPRANLDAVDRSSTGAQAETLPWVSGSYPAGYYLLAAGAYELARTAFGLDPIAAIRAVRLIGTVALGVTLLAAFLAFLGFGFAPLRAWIATCVVAVFPMSSWVSAMLQPDVLTTMFAAIALALVLALRRRPDALRLYVPLALTIAALAFVKAPYAVLVFAGLLPPLIATCIRRPRRRRLLALGAYATVAFAAVALSFASLRHGTNSPHLFTARQFLQPGDWLRDFERIYFAGVAHDTFWTSRDWSDTGFFTQPALGLIRAALSIASLIVLTLVALTVFTTARRLIAISRFHPRLALAVALGDASFWLYVTWTFGLIVMDLAIDGHIGLLGRYWWPVMIPLLVLVARSVSRPRFPKQRAALATAVLGAWLAYAILVAPFAFAQTEQRFYGPAVARTFEDRDVNVERLWDSTGTTFTSETLPIASKARLCFRGLAIDSRYGLPAKGMLLQIDERYFPLTYGLARSAPANFYNDDRLVNIGFDGCVSMKGLAPGDHPARLVVVANDGAKLRWPPHVTIRVTQPVATR